MNGYKTVAVDFDGVIADYSLGWQGAGQFGAPVPGVQSALRRLKEDGWTVVVYTVRGEIDLVMAYLSAHGIPFDDVTNQKPRARVYIDDRAVRFDGDWAQTYLDLQGFEPWYKREDENERP